MASAPTSCASSLESRRAPRSACPTRPGSEEDSTAPSVSVTGPSSGATVSGTATFTATAADNAAVAGVQFFLNGSPAGAEVAAAPYSLNWDTSRTANGNYVLTARARDVAGNLTTSAGVNPGAIARTVIFPTFADERTIATARPWYSLISRAVTRALPG